MAKQDSDCITLDLFSDIRKVGRPKTNPLSREQQIRINKRNQLKRDKSSGLKRVELKLHEGLVQQLEDLASTLNVSRSELIVTILQGYFKKNYLYKFKNFLQYFFIKIERNVYLYSFLECKSRIFRNSLFFNVLNSKTKKKITFLKMELNKKEKL